MILLITVAWFFVASPMAGVSTNMAMLVAARALQGTAGGGILQMIIVTISDLFSLRKRSHFAALLELIWTIAGGVVPLLGDVFAQYVSWRWRFYINLPINGLPFFLVLLIMDVHNPHTGSRNQGGQQSIQIAPIRAPDWIG